MVQPDESRVLARYQRMLSEAHDREARYAALADTLADRVEALEKELAAIRAAPGGESGD